MRVKWKSVPMRIRALGWPSREEWQPMEMWKLYDVPWTSRKLWLTSPPISSTICGPSAPPPRSLLNRRLGCWRWGGLRNPAVLRARKSGLSLPVDVGHRGPAPLSLSLSLCWVCRQQVATALSRRHLEPWEPLDSVTSAGTPKSTASVVPRDPAASAVYICLHCSWECLPAVFHNLWMRNLWCRSVERHR